MITIVLFEDNKSLRQSLSQYFNSTDEVFLAGAFENANEAVAKIRKHRPDVVLMDIQMPGLSGIEAMQRIITAYPDSKVRFIPYLRMNTVFFRPFAGARRAMF